MYSLWLFRSFRLEVAILLLQHIFNSIISVNNLSLLLFVHRCVHYLNPNAL